MIARALAVGFVGVLLSTSPTRLTAQKKCRTGIPCGNSCISATKTCRIGSSAPATARPGATSSQPASLLSPAAGRWVGSVADRVYFLATCSAALDLAADNRVTFASPQDAERLGFRASRVPGCSDPPDDNTAKLARASDADSSLPFVFSDLAGYIYYRNDSSCVAAGMIAKRDRRYLATAAAAAALGKKRSTDPGC